MKAMDIMKGYAAGENGIGTVSGSQKNQVKTDAFSGVLKQYGRLSANTAGDSQMINGSQADVKQITYSAKQNQIQPAKKLSVEETVQENKDAVDGVPDRIVQTIAEDLNVDEQQIVEAMEALGLTAMQLLQPQNLTELVQTITGTDDPSGLLLSADFQQTMKDMSDLTGEILQQLDLGETQLDELVNAMQPLEETVQTDTIIPETDRLQNVTEVPQTDQADVTSGAQEQNRMQNPDEETETVIRQESISQDVPAEDTDRSENTENRTTVEVEMPDEPVENLREQSETGDSEMKQKNGEAQENDNVLLNGTTTSQIEPENIFPTGRQETAIQMNVIDMIEQIAEQTKITLSQDVSTMEMQLKPENLGKVYLEVSTREGAVRAQIAVQDEMVKDALQAQVATLQEKLNQAGVRVDAVEVTVASHQFEKNLEQDQKQQGEPNAEQDHSGTRGRNLKLDELDGMNGLMTEEEQLAAQIMKDNGNSVDLTA